MYIDTYGTTPYFHLERFALFYYPAWLLNHKPSYHVQLSFIHRWDVCQTHFSLHFPRVTVVVLIWKWPGHYKSNQRLVPWYIVQDVWTHQYCTYTSTCTFARFSYQSTLRKLYSFPGVVIVPESFSVTAQSGDRGWFTSLRRPFYKSVFRLGGAWDWGVEDAIDGKRGLYTASHEWTKPGRDVTSIQHYWRTQNHQ